MKKPPLQKSSQRGIAILELLGALAIGAIILVGISSAVDTSLEDLKGQQAAYYQSQLASAASKYIAANSAALQAATTSAAVVVPINITQLKSELFLPNNLAEKNVYGQVPCVLVRQPDPISYPGRFDALVTTTGGQAIPEREIAVIAMNAGQGGGYISTTDPTVAKGASWTSSTSAYHSVACTGASALTGGAADAGHLASNLFYDGPGQLSTDFLYRDAVPGRPELNRMNTSIRMADAALVSAGSSCLNQAGVAEAGMAIDSSTRSVLTCNTSGVWSYPSQWKEPVSSFSLLPISGSLVGDVRMVTDLSRAFTYDGTQWVALAVDQNGDFLAPGTITSQQMHAQQSIQSDGMIMAAGNISSDADVIAKNDVNAMHDVNVTHNANVGRDVFAVGGVDGAKWMSTDHVQIYGNNISAGDACNLYVYDTEDNAWYIDRPIGTIAMDINSIPLICNADKIFRYANGTYEP